MSTGWIDRGAPVEAAELGPKVRRLLTMFEARYRHGCRHADEVQLARAGDLFSRCGPCIDADEGIESWLSGACATCGRAVTEPAGRLWMTEVAPTEVIVAVLLCDQCASEQLGAIETKPAGRPRKGKKK